MVTIRVSGIEDSQCEYKYLDYLSVTHLLLMLSVVMVLQGLESKIYKIIQTLMKIKNYIKIQSDGGTLGFGFKFASMPMNLNLSLSVPLSEFNQIFLVWEKSTEYWLKLELEPLQL